MKIIFFVSIRWIVFLGGVLCVEKQKQLNNNLANAFLATAITAWKKCLCFLKSNSSGSWLRISRTITSWNLHSSSENCHQLLILARDQIATSRSRNTLKNIAVSPKKVTCTFFSDFRLVFQNHWSLQDSCGLLDHFHFPEKSIGTYMMWESWYEWEFRIVEKTPLNPLDGKAWGHTLKNWRTNISFERAQFTFSLVPDAFSVSFSTYSTCTPWKLLDRFVSLRTTTCAILPWFHTFSTLLSIFQFQLRWRDLINYKVRNCKNPFLTLGHK